MIEIFNSEDIKTSTNLDISRNPILNSADDITDELLEKIINNDLDSLTINYEFTRRPKEDEHRWDWQDDLLRNNPFKRANKIKSIHRIEFESDYRTIVSREDECYGEREYQGVFISGVVSAIYYLEIRKTDC